MLIDVVDERGCKAGLPTVDATEDDSEQSESWVSVPLGIADVLEGVTQPLNRERFRKGGEDEVVSGLVGRDGGSGRVRGRIEKDVIILPLKGLEGVDEDILNHAKLVV